MTYLAPARLEARAAELWRRFALEPGFDAEALVDALELGLLWEALEDGDGGGKVFGALRPWERVVVLNERHMDLLEAKPGLRRFTLAHEIGHWLLHVNHSRDQLAFVDGAQRVWCRERSMDPREVQAEAFAGYLLSPTDQLRNRLPSAPWKGWPPVYRLAEAFGTTPTAMIVRLEVGGWAHRNAAGVPTSGPRPVPNQPSLFDVYCDPTVGRQRECRLARGPGEEVV